MPTSKLQRSCKCYQTYWFLWAICFRWWQRTYRCYECITIWVDCFTIPWLYLRKCTFKQPNLSHKNITQTMGAVTAQHDPNFRRKIYISSWKRFLEQAEPWFLLIHCDYAFQMQASYKTLLISKAKRKCFWDVCQLLQAPWMLRPQGHSLWITLGYQ